MTTKHPLLVGVLAGACITLAAMLAAQVRPVPLLQPDQRFSQNVDIPGTSGEPVFYMQIEVDGHLAYFSCVKHESLLVPGGINPK